MEKEKYRLVIQFEVEAIDVMAARILAFKLLDEVGNLDLANVKLQKLVNGKPPEGVPFTVNFD